VPVFRSRDIGAARWHKGGISRMTEKVFLFLFSSEKEESFQDLVFEQALRKRSKKLSRS